VFFRISLIYLRLVCEREMLTTDYFAMLVVGLPAFIERSCPAIETTFPDARTHDAFRRCGLFSCNISAETSNFNLGPLFLSVLGSKLKKSSSPWTEPRTDFHSCGVSSCNLPGETNRPALVLALLFYGAYFSSYRNYLNRISNSGQFFGLVEAFL
jgi:hypothetical protein